MSDQALTKVRVPERGEVVRQGFGETEMEVTAETAGTAMAAQARAAVEAAYIMALRRPRDMDQVRVKLLKACERRGFAEAARWERPVGREKNPATGRWEEKIGEGLSIRFAEEAARNMGNLDMGSYTTYDDNRKKMVQFTVTDLETNTKWWKSKTIEKTRESSKLWKGQQAVGQRLNSEGEVVFIVEATSDEVNKREGAEASKAWRDGILRNLPSDIKEECLDAIKQTIASQATVDPDGEKKRILDAFAKLGVEPVHLKEYLGHELSSVSPAELVALRGIYTSIKEGTATWADILATKQDTDAANERASKQAQPQVPPTAAQPPGSPAQATGAPPSPAGPAAAATQNVPKGQRNLTDVAAASRAKRQGAAEGPAGTPPPEREPGGDDGDEKK